MFHSMDRGRRPLVLQATSVLCPKWNENGISQMRIGIKYPSNFFVENLKAFSLVIFAEG